MCCIDEAEWKGEYPMPRKRINFFDRSMDEMYSCIICGDDTPGFYCNQCRQIANVDEHQRKDTANG